MSNKTSKIKLQNFLEKVESEGFFYAATEYTPPGGVFETLGFNPTEVLEAIKLLQEVDNACMEAGNDE